MFFRQPSNNWAFGTLMKGLHGRNAQQVAQPLQTMLSDLVYPANTHWDQTVEQQALHQQGAFGQAGIHGKASLSGLIGNGQLPCIASRTDQARIQMGHMTPADLQRLQNSPNPNIPQDVKNFAGMMQQNRSGAHPDGTHDSSRLAKAAKHPQPEHSTRCEEFCRNDAAKQIRRASRWDT